MFVCVLCSNVTSCCVLKVKSVSCASSMVQDGKQVSIVNQMVNQVYDWCLEVTQVE